MYNSVYADTFNVCIILLVSNYYESECTFFGAGEKQKTPRNFQVVTGDANIAAARQPCVGQVLTRATYRTCSLSRPPRPSRVQLTSHCQPCSMPEHERILQERALRGWLFFSCHLG